MKNIECALLVLERFMNCNQEGSDGITYTRNNLRDMFLKAMQNLDLSVDKERIGLMTESFLFLDDLLEKLQVVSPDEVEKLGNLIRKSLSN